MGYELLMISVIATGAQSTQSTTAGSLVKLCISVLSRYERDKPCLCGYCWLSCMNFFLYLATIFE